MVKDLCFEIIEKCPNKCAFCSSNSCIDRNNIVSFDTFKSVIDHLIEDGGIEEISLSGGEPMLHPRIFDMISYCHSLGMRVVLFTSGLKRREKLEDKSLLSPSIKKIVDMVEGVDFTSLSNGDFRKLKECGLDKIVFDFQGAEVDTYGELMGKKEHWPHVANSMIRASNSGLSIDVHFIPLKPNFREIVDLVELLNIAEIKSLSILNFVPQGRGKRNADKLMLSEIEMIEFAELFDIASKEFNGVIRVGIPLNKDNAHKCTAGLSKMVIKYDGTVLPCPAFKEIDAETLKKYGIKLLNIYTSLDEVHARGGTRLKPLCKEVYKFYSVIK